MKNLPLPIFRLMKHQSLPSMPLGAINMTPESRGVAPLPADNGLSATAAAAEDGFTTGECAPIIRVT